MPTMRSTHLTPHINNSKLISTMRLTDGQRLAIREAITRHFGAEARVQLFGSRVDDSRRGGDIDLLVEIQSLDPDSQEAVTRKLRAIAEIQSKIGERKVDLVIANATSEKEVVRQARKQGVRV